MLDKVIAKGGMVIGRPSKASRAKVELGLPVRDADGVWSCSVRVLGVGDARVTPALGETSLQALLLALELAYIRIRAIDPGFTPMDLGGMPIGLESERAKGSKAARSHKEQKNSRAPRTAR